MSWRGYLAGLLLSWAMFLPGIDAASELSGTARFWFGTIRTVLCLGAVALIAAEARGH